MAREPKCRGNRTRRVRVQLQPPYRPSLSQLASPFFITIMPEPTVSIPVPSEDPKKKEDKPNAKADGKLKDDEKEGEDLVGVHKHTCTLNPSAYAA